MTIAHDSAHPKSGRTVQLRVSAPGSSEEHLQDFTVEDWWDRIAGDSWMDSDGNPAAINYALRAGSQGLPLDDEVVYGKINSMGYLVHVSEVVTDE